MDHLTREIHLASDADTSALGALIAPYLKAGDVILLSGQIGAGKTHFARSAIQSRLKTDEDVPSPTFTLVQTYHDGSEEIWHADLYRISSTFEVEELGLFDAFDTAICLVEWPEVLGDEVPEGALRMAFSVSKDGHSRDVTITGCSSRWRALFQHLA